MEFSWPSFLWNYLITVGSFWWFLVVDGALVVIDIVAKARGKEWPIPPRWLLRIAVAGLICAQVFAYKELKGNTESLSGEVGDILAGRYETTQHTFALINMTVNNTGNPTYSNNYRLHLQFGSIDKWFHPTAIPPQGMTYAHVTTPNQPRLRLTPDDQIMYKTEHPISTGDGQNGWMLYDLGDVNLESLAVAQVTWTITFQDIHKHTYSASKTATNFFGVPTSGITGGVYQFYFGDQIAQPPPPQKHTPTGLGNN